MTHLTDLQLSMGGDDETLDEAADHHLAGCEACRARVEALRTERDLLQRTLAEPVVVPPIPAIRFTRSMTFGRFAVLNVITGFVIWSVQFLWKMIFEGLIFEVLSWFDLPVPDVFDLTVGLVLTIYEEGATMLDQYLGVILTCLLAAGLGLAGFYLRRLRGHASLLALLAICVMVVPESAHALEVLQGDDDAMAILAEGELIDDTLVAGGATVMIDGDVTGDLFAFGRRIVVNGSVGGNLTAFGESVTVNGGVGGTIYSAAQSISVRDAVIGRNLIGAAANIDVEDGAEVGGNGILAGERLIVSGPIRNDLVTAVETLELDAAIGGDVEVAAAQIRLLGEAAVQGDLRVHTDDEDNLQMLDGAMVNGEVAFLDQPDDAEPRNRYLSGRFYLAQLLQLVAAFIGGMILLWLWPGLQTVTIDDGIDGAKTAGIGLVSIISLPVVAVICAITLVGLPVAIIGLVFWAAVIYCAKIMVAVLAGRWLLASSDKAGNTVAVLMVGLLAVMVLVNLPLLGGIVSFLLTIIGAGLLMQRLLTYATAR